MTKRVVGIWCAVLFFVSGCSTSAREQKEILQVLAVRADALNSRDVARCLSVVSRQYNYNGKDYRHLEESLKTDFSGISNLSYEPDRPRISVNGSRAESVTGYRMKVVSQEKEVKLNGTEHLTLAREPGGWKIVAGI